MIHRHRGNRRDINQKKAERKARIIHENNDYWFYTSIHELYKGKIHCSCPMCAAKTNSSINKSHGPVSGVRSFCRIACTNNRLGKKNWKHSDAQKIIGMNLDLSEL